MRQLRRVLLIAIIIVGALGAVLLIGANLYVQSQATQARIQQELSRRIGAPVKLGRISVTPWGGLTISGVTIAQTLGRADAPFIEAKTFRLRIRFMSLFSQMLVIRDVSLIDPVVTWPQDEAGHWVLPNVAARRQGERDGVQAPAVAATIAPSPAEPGAPVTSTPVAPPPSIATNTPAEPAPAPRLPDKTSSFQPEVRHVRVVRGSFHFLDRVGHTVATFENVNFNSTFDRNLDLRGQATIDHVSIRERFFLTGVKCSIRFNGEELQLQKIAGNAGAGELVGDFRMQPQAPDSPFSASVQFRNVLADQLVTDAGGHSGIIRGKLDGNFNAKGSTAHAEALTGSGEITLREGELQQYSLLVALGQIFQIEELTQLRLEQAGAKYRVEPGIIRIDQMMLQSPNTRLSATGTIDFDGKLNLQSQLAINEKVRGQLFKPIRQNFQPIDEPGYSAINFDVTGTVERPKTNLIERVVGKDLKSFGSVINRLLGGGGEPKERKQKKRKNENAPDEAASETPPDVPTASPSGTP